MNFVLIKMMISFTRHPHLNMYYVCVFHRIFVTFLGLLMQSLVSYVSSLIEENISYTTHSPDKFILYAFDKRLFTLILYAYIFALKHTRHIHKLLLAFHGINHGLHFLNICLMGHMSFHFSTLYALTKIFKTCHTDNYSYVNKWIHICIYNSLKMLCENNSPSLFSTLIPIQQSIPNTLQSFFNELL